MLLKIGDTAPLMLTMLISPHLCSDEKVIGLHKNGYGRILSECTYTAKMLYCLWVTLPEEDDNFIIETTKPLPKWKGMSTKEQKQFMRERIIGKSNEDLAKVKLMNMS